MPTFKDSAGREWLVEVNTNAIKRVKSLAGLDLIETVTGKGGGAPVDPSAVADCLCALLRPQLEPKGVTDEQFGEALNGDAFEAAIDALTEAIIDFFPKGRRGAVRATLAKVREAEAHQTEALIAKLAATTPADLARQLYGAVGPTPASSASTPGPVPNAS